MIDCEVETEDCELGSWTEDDDLVLQQMFEVNAARPPSQREPDEVVAQAFSSAVGVPRSASACVRRLRRLEAIARSESEPTEKVVVQPCSNCCRNRGKPLEFVSMRSLMNDSLRRVGATERVTVPWTDAEVQILLRLREFHKSANSGRTKQLHPHCWSRVATDLELVTGCPRTSAACRRKIQLVHAELRLAQPSRRRRDCKADVEHCQPCRTDRAQSTRKSKETRLVPRCTPNDHEMSCDGTLVANSSTSHAKMAQNLATLPAVADTVTPPVIPISSKTPSAPRQVGSNSSVLVCGVDDPKRGSADPPAGFVDDSGDGNPEKSAHVTGDAKDQCSSASSLSFGTRALAPIRVPSKRKRHFPTCEILDDYSEEEIRITELESLKRARQNPVNGSIEGSANRQEGTGLRFRKTSFAGSTPQVKKRSLELYSDMNPARDLNEWSLDDCSALCQVLSSNAITDKSSGSSGGCGWESVAQAFNQLTGTRKAANSIRLLFVKLLFDQNADEAVPSEARQMLRQAVQAHIELHERNSAQHTEKYVETAGQTSTSNVAKQADPRMKISALMTSDVNNDWNRANTQRLGSELNASGLVLVSDPGVRCTPCNDYDTPSADVPSQNLRWTSSEDRVLLELVDDHTQTDWEVVAKEVSRKSTRLRTLDSVKARHRRLRQMRGAPSVSELAHASADGSLDNCPARNDSETGQLVDSVWLPEEDEILWTTCERFKQRPTLHSHSTNGDVVGLPSNQVSASDERRITWANVAKVLSVKSPRGVIRSSKACRQRFLHMLTKFQENQECSEHGNEVEKSATIEAVEKILLLDDADLDSVECVGALGEIPDYYSELISAWKDEQERHIDEFQIRRQVSTNRTGCEPLPAPNGDPEHAMLSDLCHWQESGNGCDRVSLRALDGDQGEATRADEGTRLEVVERPSFMRTTSALPWWAHCVKVANAKQR